MKTCGIEVPGEQGNHVIENDGVRTNKQGKPTRPTLYQLLYETRQQ